MITLCSTFDEALVPFSIRFWLSKKLRKLTDCAKTLLFDFRHITEFQGLCKSASFWISETSRDFIYCMSSSNNPRTKLGYDTYLYVCRGRGCHTPSQSYWESRRPIGYDVRGNRGVQRTFVAVKVVAWRGVWWSSWRYVLDSPILLLW